jgi:hypothetical protein
MAVLALACASSAQAAGYNCSSSALRASVLGGPALEPTTANQGATTCRDVVSTLASPATALGLPISSSAVAAYTSLAGAGAGQRALAAGGVADLKVLALPSLPVSIAQITAPATAALNGVSTPLNAIPVPLPSAVTAALTLLALPTTVSLDLTQAVQPLVPATRALSASELLGVQSAMAYAGASCANGSPSLIGVPQLAGLTIAGQAVPTDQATSRTLTLLPALTVDFSTADPAKVLTSANATTLLGSANPLITTLVKNQLTAAIQSTISSTLAQLPKLTVPAITASVAVAPGATVRSGNQLTQQALAISASVAGLKVIDAVIGEATAAADNVDCTPATTPGTTVPTTTTGASLQCSTRRLVLTDVLQVADRVKLTGVADPTLAGRTVAIVFGATGQTVAHATVSRAGTFATTAPLPVASIRDTNAARYTAKVGKEQSINLKLRRRMILSSITNRNGKVTIVGRVVGPLDRPVAPVVLRRRVSCREMRVVGRFRPRSDGRFRIVVPAPKGPGAAVYRLTTTVHNPGSNRSFSTFTLPHAVELAG